MRALALSLLVALLVAGGALAQQYRWVDEKGRVHYSDTPPPPSAKSAQKKNLKGNAVGTQPNYELTQAIKNSPVKLYSHPDCKQSCQTVRDTLNKRGVPFSEISAADNAGLAELRRVSGGESVPVLLVGNQVETSLSIDSINRALDLAGYPKAGVVPARSQAAPPAEAAAPKP
jgi:glutaredoxin